MKIEALIDCTVAALPRVEATQAAGLCLAQIATASPQEACTLLDAVIGAPRWISSHELSGKPIAQWPQKAREALLQQARGLAPGRERVEAFCCLAPWISEQEKREALGGLFDGTSPESFWAPFAQDDKAVWGNRKVHKALLDQVPDAWKEEWIDRQSKDLLIKLSFRKDLDHWPEPQARGLFARVWAMRDERADAIPSEFSILMPHLPRDLREQAIGWARTHRTPDTCASLLEDCPDELTAEELAILLRIPQEEGDSWVWYRVSELRPHLRRAPYEVRLRWLAALREIEGSEQGLAHLVPLLEEPERGELLRYLIAQILSRQNWHPVGEILPFLLPTVAGELISALVEGEKVEGSPLWGFEAIAAQPQPFQDACLEPVYAKALHLRPQALVAFLRGSPRWLARRTKGSFSRLLAESLQAHPGLLSLPHKLNPL